MAVLRPLLRNLADRAARRYIAGPQLADALAFARRMAAADIGSTIAYWNDVGEDRLEVQAAYLAAIDAAASAPGGIYVSIKAPALSMSETLARELALRCRAGHVALHFDSLAVEWQARTFELIERLLQTGVQLGCTLPGRFSRSLDDVELAVRHRLRVRVVKGQWQDPGRSVDARRGFMAVVERLAGRAVHVAVATHDPRLAQQSLEYLAAKGTPAEVELLFGLPVYSVLQVARRQNVPVRMYIPYGRAWLPYALSAMRRNPRVLWWVLADAARGRSLGPSLP